MRCDELRDLIPLEALDLLDPGEEARVREHLESGCPGCAAEMAAARETAHMIPFALPDAEPSATAKARLMERVRAESGGRAAAGAPARGGAPGAILRPFRSSWKGAAVSALAASLVTAVAAAALMTVRQEDLVARYEALAADLRRTIERQGEDLASLQRQVRAARESILFVSAPGVVTVDLQGQGDRPGPAARVFWDRRREQWRLFAPGLSVPAAGRTYQLWLVTDAGAKISAGTFSDAADDAAEGSVTVPEAAGRVVAAAVTDEPAGGSPQPTSAPFLLGKV